MAHKSVSAMGKILPRQPVNKRGSNKWVDKITCFYFFNGTNEPRYHIDRLSVLTSCNAFASWTLCWLTLNPCVFFSDGPSICDTSDHWCERDWLLNCCKMILINIKVMPYTCILVEHVLYVLSCAVSFGSRRLHINPHPHMRGPCGPRKTLPGAPVAFFGTPEPTVHLIVHNTEPLSQTTLFFPPGTVMALKPWHNALSALGSVQTP